MNFFQALQECRYKIGACKSNSGTVKIRAYGSRRRASVYLHGKCFFAILDNSAYNKNNFSRIIRLANCSVDTVAHHSIGDYPMVIVPALVTVVYVCIRACVPVLPPLAVHGIECCSGISVCLSSKRFSSLGTHTQTQV